MRVAIVPSRDSQSPREIAPAGRSVIVTGVVRFKDVVTLANLLCGAAAVVFCIEHRASWAAIALIIAYAFDALDGAVARWTGGGNRFGAELDNLADYVTFGIAPAFVVYEAYRPAALWLGVALGAALVVASTVRHVRNLVFEAPTTLCWIGLPRPAAGLITIALVESNLFQAIGPWGGVPILAGVAYALLATFPCINHRGRKLQPWVRTFGWAWVLSWVTVLLFLPHWFWDTVLGWVIAYATLSWVALEPQELAKFRETVANWKQRIRAAS